MQPRSSSSTVQPLSKSRVLAMAAGAGGWTQATLPRGSNTTLVLGETEWELAEAPGERPGAKDRGEQARPLLGRGGVVYCCHSRG